jgi:hypothetical protein
MTPAVDIKKFMNKPSKKGESNTERSKGRGSQYT